MLDALTYVGYLSTINSLVFNQRVQFVHGDITDSALVASLLDAHKIDTIVHFAAE